ncbi:hypothetical protein LIER_04289 [Lithospermum erythrorhizon]|uniref:Uncharacterized protein n=1 Tax=Lithospermum erythrorhizon TaxID=34254 RepID=A0AAV3P0D1_LITER
MNIKYWIYRQKISAKEKLQKMMKCICSGEQFRAADDIIPSSESLATRDYSASGYSSRAGETDAKDSSNIEEAESSLRESGFLNYEEARALLGRLEYQKGNIEAALRVFEGIDVDAVTPKIRATITRRCEFSRRDSHSDANLPMSMHAVSLLFEAIFLKAKSYQALGRFSEAAKSCKVIPDTIESASPYGLPEILSADCKLMEILNKAVGLLPQLWKLAHAPEEIILAYRRALLYQWNLDTETRTNIEKEFATFLLYSGTDATPPNLRSQAEGSFVPRNNIEEAILILLVLLGKFALKKIAWDPSILDHLCYALSIAGELSSFARQVEELPPRIIGRKEKYTTLALCYYGEGDDLVALNLLRNMLNNKENHKRALELLLASKICGENTNYHEEGIEYLQKVPPMSRGNCNQTATLTNFLFGLLQSARSRRFASDFERSSRQSEALKALETADRMSVEKNPDVLFHLSLENAEQRKLDVALHYAKQLLKLEAGSRVNGWILLAQILSAQKRYVDAENIINAALDETGKWDQGDLLRVKAKLQNAQGHVRDAIGTYTHLLAVLQVQRKNFGAQEKVVKSRRNMNKSLEMETWHDLANIYTSVSQWRDAEVCLIKSEAISNHSASRLHSKGLLYEARSLYSDALKFFEKALDIDPNHVPSLISTAITLQKINNRSLPVVKSFLSNALRLDRTNPTAWYHLGLLYKAEGGSSAVEAAECFEAAAQLQESAPIEPFRL